MTDSREPTDERKACPTCGHLNIPRAAFCAQCGRSLQGDGTRDAEAQPDDDAQSTSVYTPIGSPGSDATSSPWAAPGTSQTIIDVDPGQTTAFPISQPLSYSDDSFAAVPELNRAAESIRGFWLGIVAGVLIAAVLALYVYSAWLSDSTRDTVDGWLPWVT